MHYPQTAIIASYGKRLLDWLNEYTFPEEKKFIDINYARKVASLTLDLCIKNGTTTIASFCTTSINSVDAFFEEAQKRNMSVIAGKTCMDRNAPEYLIDSVNSAYDDSKRLIKKWHNNNRSYYAITPRFAPTSTPEQLESLGSLWSEYPDCLMQTHLSEQKEEIEWVSKLFPEHESYLDIYDKFNLVKKNSIFGHCIHLKGKEIEMLKERQSSIAHCPTSNTFIGSGVFKLKELNSKKINIGLATDTGGGTSFSMIKTIAEAYKISQLNNFSIHPAQLFWLATVGSSKSLGLENKIGNIKEGYFADLIVINLASTLEIEQRQKRAKNFWESFFPTLIMGDDRAIIKTWVFGNEIK
tara:strand:- start:771 stop:1835 length:1065 start_codon:yes stop_codon:yes gene_type:complete